MLECCTCYLQECQTTYEQQCQTKYEQQCSTTYEEVCEQAQPQYGYGGYGAPQQTCKQVKLLILILTGP